MEKSHGRPVIGLMKVTGMPWTNHCGQGRAGVGPTPGGQGAEKAQTWPCPCPLVLQQLEVKQ